MNHFASPFWVNLLILVPIVLWFYLRRNKLHIKITQLVYVVLFGIGFGFIESAVVIYLRAATGLLPGFEGTLADVQRQAIEIFYNQQALTAKLPMSLLTVEIIREVGTMLMLLMIACVAAKRLKEKIAVFFLAFAAWDLFYYVFLYVTVHWPQNLTTKDVLFLIPQPWIGEVWIPILVDILMIGTIFLNIDNTD